MKEWWHNLALREKQTVAAGSLLVILFLLYEIIWSPLSNLNDNLRLQIQEDHKTLARMENADQLIRHMQQESRKNKIDPSESASSILQSEINKSTFASHATQLRQAENNSVQVNLNKVDFDSLITFLTQLWKQYGLIVSQLSVTPTGVPGEVTVDLVMATG